MEQTGKKNIIGIMGGIASGKSTVAKALAARGCAVIDADQIAKEFLKKDEVKAQIRDEFGDGVFDNNGEIDNKKLADVVFSSPDMVKKINAVIHPMVLAQTQRLVEKYQKQPVKAIVLDMPLLTEVGWDARCDKLIFVQCDEKIRLKRAQKTGFLSENELKKRENLQISLDKKADMVQYRVENNDLSELTKQIEKLFPILIAKR
ncbi:MAG: dephospho-CoA kinase [Sedimentisphaerales bacterium]|nr:dephospho-CoA kinase [Sedimentisphaerales bacterium]